MHFSLSCMERIKLLDKTNIILGTCIILLQLCDSVITLIGLNKGVTEGNPLVAFFMEQFGVLGGLLFTKGLVVMIVCGFIIYNKNIELIRMCFLMVMIIYLVCMIVFTVEYIMTIVL